MPTKIGIGTKFNHPYADGNPEWTVIGKAGVGVWKCEIKEDVDWQGTQKVFMRAEILSAMSMSARIKALFSNQDNWYESLRIGQILHYRDGDKYVRSEVTEIRDATGKWCKVLMPFALVGNVRETPTWSRTGEVRWPYHHAKIRNRETFTPNFTSIYESPAYNKRAGEVNPASLPEVSLEPPPMPDAIRENMDVWRALQAVEDLMRLRNEPDANPYEIYEAIRERTFIKII